MKMKSKKNHNNLIKFIEIFNDQYQGRPTRLGVFERENGVMNDYWIESGLPLNGLYLDCRGRLPALRINMGTFSHEIVNILQITVTLTVSGDEDGINVLDGSGRTTVLRIEPTSLPPPMSDI